MKKNPVISSITFCLLISIVVVGSFVAFASTREGAYPFDKQISMAKHYDVKIENIGDIKPNENGEIPKDSLKDIPDNAMIGEMNYKDNLIQLVYNCNDVSLIETARLIAGKAIVGEIGCARIYGYRLNMEPFMDVPVGDVITLKLSYGEYEFKCVEKSIANSTWDATRQDFDVSRGLALYTDKADEYGFSGEYDVTVFEMISGPKVIG